MYYYAILLKLQDSKYMFVRIYLHKKVGIHFGILKEKDFLGKHTEKQESATILL